MIETIASVGLPVGEVLRIKKIVFFLNIQRKVQEESVLLQESMEMNWKDNISAMNYSEE